MIIDEVADLKKNRRELSKRERIHKLKQIIERAREIIVKLNNKDAQIFLGALPNDFKRYLNKDSPGIDYSDLDEKLFRDDL